MALGCNCNLVLPGCRRFESACSDFFLAGKTSFAERETPFCHVAPVVLSDSVVLANKKCATIPSESRSLYSDNRSPLRSSNVDVISCADDPSKISSREMIFEEYL